MTGTSFESHPSPAQLLAWSGVRCLELAAVALASGSYTLYFSLHWYWWMVIKASVSIKAMHSTALFLCRCRHIQWCNCRALSWTLLPTTNYNVFTAHKSRSLNETDIKCAVLSVANSLNKVKLVGFHHCPPPAIAPPYSLDGILLLKNYVLKTMGRCPEIPA